MNDLNFSWSLNPILIILRILGVNLQYANTSHTNCLWGTCYSIILLIFNICSQTFSLVLYIFPKIFNGNNQGTDDNKKMEETLLSFVNTIIDYSNFGLLCISSQFFLLTILRSRWKTLIEEWRVLEKQLEPQFFIQLHNISIICSIIIILLVLYI